MCEAVIKFHNLIFFADVASKYVIDNATNLIIAWGFCSQMNAYDGED